MPTVNIFNDKKELVVSFKSDNIAEDIKEFKNFKGWYYTTIGEIIRINKTHKNRTISFNTCTSLKKGYKRHF